MGAVEVETVLKQVEALLAGAGELPAEVEQAIGMLLNVVETLSADRRELTQEVARLRQQLEQKKKGQNHQQTLTLLRDEFTIPDKWQQRLAAWLAQRGGDVEYDAPSLKLLLDDWFGGSCQQLRTAIEQAAAIISCRRQTSLPVIQVLFCDDAGQFKLLTDHLALCWIHAGRHSEQLAPVMLKHARALDNFTERFWDFYAGWQDYRAGPSEAWAAKLRAEFDTLFATRTGYDALDDRIAKTAAKKEQLLTVLSHPAVGLHNNASELGARVSARRRDVSLHSRSPRGARAMDIFTTLVQTCQKLSLSAYAYFHAHLRQTLSLPSLATHIHQAAAGV